MWCGLMRQEKKVNYDIGVKGQEGAIRGQIVYF